jgi:predicted nucleic acid-binding protein
MTREIPRLVLDANIMVSALLGRSLPLLASLFDNGVRLLAPVQQLAETRNVLTRKSFLSESEIAVLMDSLLRFVMPLHPFLLDKHEDKARARLHERGQPDWPVLAASMETKSAIWSHDKDFFGSGASVWSTSILRKQLAESVA